MDQKLAIHCALLWLRANLSKGQEKAQNAYYSKGYPFAVMDTTSEPTYAAMGVDILWMRRKWCASGISENHLPIMVLPKEQLDAAILSVSAIDRKRIMESRAAILQMVDPENKQLLEVDMATVQKELQQGYAVVTSKRKLYDLGSLVEEAKLYLHTIRNEYTQEDTISPKNDPFSAENNTSTML